MMRLQVAFFERVGVRRWVARATQRLTPRLFLFLFLFLCSFPANAQDVILKTGQTITSKGVRRSGDMIMGKIQVGTSSGEVGYQVAAIANINFPEPPKLKKTD